MADSAVARLRGILARDMSRADIDQLLGEVQAEMGGTHVLGADGRTCAAAARKQAADDLRFDAGLRRAEGLHETAEHWDDAADFLSPSEAADA